MHTTLAQLGGTEFTTILNVEAQAHRIGSSESPSTLMRSQPRALAYAVLGYQLPTSYDPDRRRSMASALLVERSAVFRLPFKRAPPMEKGLGNDSLTVHPMGSHHWAYVFGIR